MATSTTNIFNALGDLRLMNDDDTESEIAAPVETPKPSKGRRKIVIAAVAILLLAAGAAGIFVFERNRTTAAPASAYVEIPAMLINVQSADGRQHFLKVRLTLEVAPEAKQRIQDKLPAVVDSMQSFLREVRPEDLSGTAAMFRIKEELLVRANRSAGEGQVSDVLIQELIQQ